MNKEQIENAINQNPVNYKPELFNVGFWSYVTLPFDNSTGGNVLHYWPFENDVLYKQDLMGEHFHKTAVCGMTNFNRFVPFMDYYFFENLPKCKKCLKKLHKLSSIL